jgi:hypothetical protein
MTDRLNPHQFNAVQGEQLKAFMSADEIDREFSPFDWDREEMSYEDGVSWYESNDELYDRKLEEAWDGGLRHDLAADNFKVRKPLSLAHSESNRSGTAVYPQIVGGHHRIAVLRDEAPDQLQPVLHWNNIKEAQRGGGSQYEPMGPRPPRPYPYS